MPPLDIRWFNALGFQLAWFSCLLLPGTVALLTAALFIALHGLWPLARARYLLQVMMAAFLGMLVDLMFALGGLLQFPDITLGISLNLVAVWLCFATTLSLSLGWLHGRMGLCVLLGAVFGPLSYWGGSKLGAVAFPLGDVFTLALYSATWAVLLPLLVWVAQRPGLQFSPIKKGA